MDYNFILIPHLINRFTVIRPPGGGFVVEGGALSWGFVWSLDQTNPKTNPPLYDNPHQKSGSLDRVTAFIQQNYQITLICYTSTLGFSSALTLRAQLPCLGLAFACRPAASSQWRGIEIGLITPFLHDSYTQRHLHSGHFSPQRSFSTFRSFVAVLKTESSASDLVTRTRDGVGLCLC